MLSGESDSVVLEGIRPMLDKPRGHEETRKSQKKESKHLQHYKNDAPPKKSIKNKPENLTLNLLKKAK